VTPTRPPTPFVFLLNGNELRNDAKLIIDHFTLVIEQPGSALSPAAGDPPDNSSLNK